MKQTLEELKGDSKKILIGHFSSFPLLRHRPTNQIEDPWETEGLNNSIDQLNLTFQT